MRSSPESRRKQRRSIRRRCFALLRRERPEPIEASHRRHSLTSLCGASGRDGAILFGSRSRRVAWGAVKHGFEKVGDHWEAKDENGPSDSRSEGSTQEKLAGVGETHGGVDVNGHTRDESLERAKRAGVKASSHMTKDELAEGIARRKG